MCHIFVADKLDTLQHLPVVGHILAAILEAAEFVKVAPRRCCKNKTGTSLSHLIVSNTLSRVVAAWLGLLGL